MIWNGYAGKLKLFKQFTAKHTATLPLSQNKSHKLRIATPNLTLTLKQKSAILTCKTKSSMIKNQLCIFCNYPQRHLFSKHILQLLKMKIVLYKKTHQNHKKQSLLWAFHKIYRGCLGSWCNFILSHSIWIRTYLLSSDIQFRGIWTGECIHKDILLQSHDRGLLYLKYIFTSIDLMVKSFNIKLLWNQRKLNLNRMSVT